MNRVDNINRGMSEMKPLNSIEIPSVEGKVSDDRSPMTSMCVTR